MNVAIIQGRVRAQPDRRTSHDGSLLLGFDVLVEPEEGPTQQVPVTWSGEEGEEPTLSEGARVTVVGHVLRRFYRTGGRTVSRTDVRADRIVRGVGARADAAIEAALAAHAEG